MNDRQLITMVTGLMLLAQLRDLDPDYEIDDGFYEEAYNRAVKLFNIVKKLEKENAADADED